MLDWLANFVRLVCKFVAFVIIVVLLLAIIGDLHRLIDTLGYNIHPYVPKRPLPYI